MPGGREAFRPFCLPLLYSRPAGSEPAGARSARPRDDEVRQTGRFRRRRYPPPKSIHGCFSGLLIIEWKPQVKNRTKGRKNRRRMPPAPGCDDPRHGLWRGRSGQWEKAAELGKFPCVEGLNVVCYKRFQYAGRTCCGRHTPQKSHDRREGENGCHGVF